MAWKATQFCRLLETGTEGRHARPVFGLMLAMGTREGWEAAGAGLGLRWGLSCAEVKEVNL